MVVHVCVHVWCVHVCGGALLYLLCKTTFNHTPRFSLTLIDTLDTLAVCWGGGGGRGGKGGGGGMGTADIDEPLLPPFHLGLWVS